MNIKIITQQTQDLLIQKSQAMAQREDLDASSINTALHEELASFIVGLISGQIKRAFYEVEPGLARKVLGGGPSRSTAKVSDLIWMKICDMGERELQKEKGTDTGPENSEKLLQELMDFAMQIVLGNMEQAFRTHLDRGVSDRIFEKARGLVLEAA